MPAISVIVPVYKVEKYIHRCVDSILGQTFTDFELILVDDGSPDHCGTICDEYAAKDSRVVVIHQENGGLSAARNAGIDWAFAHSDSQWLNFIDSDDWVHPEYLQRLLDAAVENNVAVSISGYAQTDGAEPEIDPNLLTPVLWNTEEFFVKHNVNATIACGKLYRKQCFQTIRYPLGKLHEDEFTTYKILFCYEQVAVILAGLYAYFTNPAGIMKSEWNTKRMDALDALRNQMLFFQRRGFAKAERECALNYGPLIMDQASKLEQCDIDKHRKRKLQMRLASRMRRLLRFQKNLYPFAENKWYYEKAYPTAMRAYWLTQALINKMKQIGGK